MAFHVAGEQRDYYGFDEKIYTTSGNVIFPHFDSARRFAEKMNEKKDLVTNPEKRVSPSEIHALALIDEILHYLFLLYRQQPENRNLLKELMQFLEESVGAENLHGILREFVITFPPMEVYKNGKSADEYLQDRNAGVPNREIEMEELIMVRLANENPAFKPFRELFDDSNFNLKPTYEALVDAADLFFSNRPGFGPQGKNILELLREPAKMAPNSLKEQLLYIRDRWGLVLKGEFFSRLLRGIDFVKEENRFVHFGGPQGETITGESLRLSSEFDPEYENFTPDTHWMPRVVMIAKNIFVWLDQLSKQYGRRISKLDEIPFDELRKLSDWGFNSLWLIGLWRRSDASRRIKQMCGNPEAAASAYSLFDYVVADELGGEESLKRLKENAASCGIRMASDMVPNHVGIDSHWVHNHPERFIQMDHPPYTVYSFNGENLSSNPDIGIYIEDHYYEKSDASVVFKRIDFRSGDTRYIYHGNDGTCMPWNDTAQLNYLDPAVREAVIETILHVASKVPIIRFDAAMTLAKRHFQRLWYPEPGSGGDIPTRSEFGLTREKFHQLFPKEFWREVVDRINEECPDTLLLAEAFWLMEGYFVRTLGMHRVYNSAFMNFLKNEENHKFRLSIKNVLEFDPHILQRFVNFLSNPDEKTSVEQFGKEDKYFGCTLLLVTMPGLPMFAHGQIEGFTEKYGMEYQKAYWNESVDWDLVERHQREIFPLMGKRFAFSSVQNFHLFDFVRAGGDVDENVYAYSNRSGEDRSLIVFNNRYSHTSGRIRISSQVLDKSSKNLVSRNIADAMSLSNDPGVFTIFRDHISNNQFIRDNRELRDQGLYIELGAFKYHAFTEFRQVRSDCDLPYDRLAEKLGGAGVADIDYALQEVIFEPVHKALGKIANHENFHLLVSGRKDNGNKRREEKILASLPVDYENFLLLIKEIDSEKVTHYSETVDRLIEAAVNLPSLVDEIGKLDPEAGEFLEKQLSSDPYYLYILFGWCLTDILSPAIEENDIHIFEKYLLNAFFKKLFVSLGSTEFHAARQVLFIKALIIGRALLKNKISAESVKKLLEKDEIRNVIQVNTFQNVTYFNKESFELLIGGLFVTDIITLDPERYVENPETLISERSKMMRELIEIADRSQFQLEKFSELLEELF